MMRAIWIVPLFLVALVAGAIAGAAVFAPHQAKSSIAFGCRFINEGERLGVWTRDQRMALVDRLAAANDKRAATDPSVSETRMRGLKLVLEQLRKPYEACDTFSELPTQVAGRR